MAPTYISQLLT